MSDITLINDSEQSSLVTNGLAKNGEMYLKKAGSTDAGSIVVYDSGVWKTFANEYSAGFSNTYSVDFDGTNDYGESSYAASSSATAISYSFWMNTSNTTSSMAIGPADYGSNSKTFRFLSPSNTKAFYVIVNDGSGNYLNNNVGGTNATISGSTNIRDGLWHHVVFTINGTSIKIYIDGGDAAINASNSSNSEGHALSVTSTKAFGGGANSYIIGKNGTSNSYYFDGLMDEVAILEYELTASQVRSIYNSGIPEDLVSYSPNVWWRMGDNDGGTGTTVTDQGSASQNLTLANGPAFSTDIPS